MIIKNEFTAFDIMAQKIFKRDLLSHCSPYQRKEVMELVKLEIQATMYFKNR